jgi:hypothetical protein
MQKGQKIFSAKWVSSQFKRMAPTGKPKIIPCDLNLEGGALQTLFFDKK